MAKESVGGIWIRKVTAKGKEVAVFKFTINGQRYEAWPNGYKKETKHPDYNIYVDDFVPKPKDGEAERTKPVEIPGDLPF